MAVIATSTPMLSSVLMGDSTSLVPDYNYARVACKEAAATDYVLGQVIVYNGTDAMKALKAADFDINDLIITTDSLFPDGALLGVVVGFDSLGDAWTASVGTTAKTVNGLFRGVVGVKENGLKFDAGLSTVQVAAAKKQLEKQGIDIKAVGAAVTSSYYGV